MRTFPRIGLLTLGLVFCLQGSSALLASEERNSLQESPEAGLKRLIEGNDRFVAKGTTARQFSSDDRRSHAKGQHPFAVILTCADSRVAPEAIFDEGPGTLFVVRIAGNFVDSGVSGSIEYAVEYLHASLIVVLGHEACGAVEAALLPAEQQAGLTTDIQYILRQIAPALSGLSASSDPVHRRNMAVARNAEFQASKIRQNPNLADEIQSGKLDVRSATYEIHSGKVTFLTKAAERGLSILGSNK